MRQLKHRLCILGVILLVGYVIFECRHHSIAHDLPHESSLRVKWEEARRFDEYGNLSFYDEKARLDNFAIQLRFEPTSSGYIIVYGTCGREAEARTVRSKNYLVTKRRIDAGRLVTIDAGCASYLLTQ
jgi:hypothetical protein